MKIKPDSYMFEMIRTELTDAVGDANVDVKFADKFGHSIDYYWIPDMGTCRPVRCVARSPVRRRAFEPVITTCLPTRSSLFTNRCHPSTFCISSKRK